VSKQCGRDERRTRFSDNWSRLHGARERRAVKRVVDVCRIGLLESLLIDPFAPLNVTQLPNRIEG
jgi:hypothetical protein